MSDKTANSLFMVSPLARYAEFYQELLREVTNHRQLGNRLIMLAEQAHVLRQFDKLKEIALILSRFPIKDYQPIGYYFLAVVANSKGNGDQDEAMRLFKQVVDTAPDPYKVKAMLSLGAVSFHKREFDAALYFYRETIKAGKLSASSLQAIRGISVLKAIEGSHNQAVKDLESILRVAQYAPSNIYLDYLNSYAVELSAIGRKQEARDVCRVVLASPFIHAYPEWLETAKELREPSRSFLAVNPVRGSNVIRLTPRSITSEDETVATVLSINDWKESKMPKKKEPPARVEPTSKSMTKKAFEIRTKILVDNEISESKMDVILGLIDNRKLPQSVIDEMLKMLESHEDE